MIYFGRDISWGIFVCPFSFSYDMPLLRDRGILLIVWLRTKDGVSMNVSSERTNNEQ